MNKPKVSIITVVFNGERYIEKTVQSVVEQDYEAIEYIIVDGKSTDNTLKILEKYRNKIAVLISEKDDGIYDAMNKGQQAATGDFVWFLNAGDYIPTPHTLSDIMKNYQGQEVIYGHAGIVNEQDEWKGLRRLVVPKHLTWKSFRLGMVVCHQAMLVKRALAVPYDLRYKIAADIDWAIRSVQRAHQALYLPFVVCHYLEGGFSEKKRWQSLQERWHIMVNHYGLLLTLFSHVQIVMNLLLYRLGMRRNRVKT